MTGFRVSRTLEQDANKLLVKWQQIADKLPEDVSIRVFLQAVNGSQQGERTVSAAFESLFLGNTSELLPLMNESFPELGLELKDCIETSRIESVLYYGVGMDSLLSFCSTELFPSNISPLNQTM